jgi:hypothetical protein
MPSSVVTSSLGTTGDIHSSHSPPLGSNPDQAVWQPLCGTKARALEISISNSSSNSPPSAGQGKLADALAAKQVEMFLTHTGDVDRQAEELAQARHDIEELKSLLEEERGARKVAERRAMELRLRLAGADQRGAEGSTQAGGGELPLPGDGQANGLRVHQYRSLVEKNPNMVDSFWVPVDRGVQVSHVRHVATEA